MSSPRDWSKFEACTIPSSLDLHSEIFTRLKKEDNILDIRCGFGKTCFDLYSKGYRSITSADINKSGIEYAQNQANKNEMIGLEFSYSLGS